MAEGQSCASPDKQKSPFFSVPCTGDSLNAFSDLRGEAAPRHWRNRWDTEPPHGQLSISWTSLGRLYSCQGDMGQVAPLSSSISLPEALSTWDQKKPTRVRVSEWTSDPTVLESGVSRVTVPSCGGCDRGFSQAAHTGWPHPAQGSEGRGRDQPYAWGTWVGVGLCKRRTEGELFSVCQVRGELNCKRTRHESNPIPLHVRHTPVPRPSPAAGVMPARTLAWVWAHRAVRLHLLGRPCLAASKGHRVNACQRLKPPLFSILDFHNHFHQSKLEPSWSGKFEPGKFNVKKHIEIISVL